MARERRKSIFAAIWAKVKSVRAVGWVGDGGSAFSWVTRAVRERWVCSAPLGVLVVLWVGREAVNCWLMEWVLRRCWAAYPEVYSIRIVVSICSALLILGQA